MIPGIKADAVSLDKTISDAFLKREKPYTGNMTGFATDTANVMMGRNHSVSVLLKNEIRIYLSWIVLLRPGLKARVGWISRKREARLAD